MPESAEHAIIRAFPAETPDHKKARIAILRLFHAGERTQWLLDDLQSHIRYFLEEPVNAIHDRVLSDTAIETNFRLIALASEMLKSAADLDSIRDEWRKP